MSLPNVNIASAFIESYITIRKASWKLNVNDGDPIKIPDDVTVKHKLAICLTLLETFKNAKTFEDWIKILDEIYANERAEFETYHNRYAIIRAIINQPLAGNMLHAVRTYIISELKNEPEFKQLKDDLAYRKKELEKQILWDSQHGTVKTEIEGNQKLLSKINRTLETRNDMDEYFLKFFNDTILVHDVEAKRFDEKTFDDLKLNVIKDKRTLIICQRLLEDNGKKFTNAPSALPEGQPQTTFSSPSQELAQSPHKDESSPCITDKNDIFQPVPTYSSIVSEGERKRQSSLQTLSTFAKTDEHVSNPRKQSTRSVNSESTSDFIYPKAKKYRHY